MEENTEDELLQLGLKFFDAARRGDIVTVQQMVDFDFPVNFQHPSDMETALHRVASCEGAGAIAVASFLVSTDKCDYLLQDRFGKIAVDNAIISGNPDMIEILDPPTREAAISKGIRYDNDRVAIQLRWAQAL